MTPQERVSSFLDRRLPDPLIRRPGLVAELAQGIPMSPDRLTKCVHRVLVEMGISVDERYVHAEYERRKAANGTQKAA